MRNCLWNKTDHVLDATMGSTNMFYFSPFDNGVDQSTWITAVTILSVYAALFLAGFIGHTCVLCFATSHKSRSSSSLSSAYVIIASSTIAQTVFICSCLPAIACKSVMSLVTSEWLFGDVPCRLTSFLETFLIGVTALSYCALAIDRLHCSRHVTRDCDVTKESCGRGFSKMLVLWLCAAFIASPELLLMETTKAKASVPMHRQLSLLKSPELRLDSPPLVISRGEYLSLLPKMNDTKAVFDSRSYVGNSSLFVNYEKCITGSNWENKFPALLAKFMTFYVAFRHWWLFTFAFFIPVLTSAIFGVLIARRLNKAVRDINYQQPSATSVFPANCSEAGTLPLRGQDFDLTPIVENGNYPTDSLPSNRTFTNDSLFQQRIALERQLSQSSYMQYHSRLAPLLSSEDLTEAETSPVLKIANGSIRSSHRHMLSDTVPLSPVAPSIACMSGISVVSLAMSNNPGLGTLGNASLPPHGHGKSIRRRSSRIQRHTLSNISRERALNFFLAISLVVFVITQIPLRVSDILRAETNWFSTLGSNHVTIVEDLSIYLSSITFVINPIVMFLCYKSYRMHLLKSLCCY
uniref:Uncharacterized protein LOC104266783 n=1 Tax=Phallusia mammillata TaxID=59560 RepID=A0A6F9DJN4_9ASCI|nr:uncharacterized protein LOC104266783 [Phallusia mammillata]